MIKSTSSSLLICFLRSIIIVTGTIILLFSFPVAALLLKEPYFKNVEPSEYFTWVYRIFTLIISLAFTRFLYQQIVKLAMFIARNSVITVMSKRSLIVSLLVTLLLVPKAAVTSLYGVVTNLFNFFRNVLNASSYLIMGPGSSSESNTGITDFISLFYRNSLDFVNRFTNEVRQLLNYLPLSDTALFISLWILIAFTSELMLGSNEQLSVKFPDIDSRWDRILGFVRIHRDKILFGTILSFSLFLSVSAMIAVPYVSQSSQKLIYDTEYLKKSLDAYLIPNSFLEEELNAHVADSLAYERQLEKWLAFSADSLEQKSGRPLPQAVRTQWTDHIAAVNGLVKQAIANDRKQVKMIRKFRKEVLARQNKESRMLSENLLLTANSLTNADEANEYFKRLVWWFSEESDNLKTMLDNEYFKLRNNTALQSSMFSFLSNSLENDVETLLKSSAGDQPYLANTENMKMYLNKQLIDIESTPLRHDAIPMPSVPKAGMSWGIFGQIAQWLLASRSYELAILTGMFGFGLFGASISTLIRSQDGEPAPTAGYRIIIKGLSAAVLLFLSIMGGTALLGIETSKPNAYTLFFLCLIGAVFSDTVWEWAKGKLSGINEQPGGTPGNS